MANKKSVYMDMTELPVPVNSKIVGGASSGTAGDENMLMFADGNVLEYHILGTQTIVAPAMTTTGLNIGMDQTADDGVELCPTILAAGASSGFTVGTDPAFYFACKLDIADASGTDDLHVGFRKVEAYQANFDDYDEAATIGVVGTSDPNTIQIETILNGGATTTTDTTDTWADAASKTLKVLVSAAGVVTYQIDGSAPTATAAFTFDDAEVVVPFVYFLHAADVAGAVNIITWDVGFQ